MVIKNNNKNTILKFRFLLLCILLIIIALIFLLTRKIIVLIQRNKHPNAASLYDKSLTFTKSSELAYYFEPEANTVDSDYPDWLGFTARYTHNTDGLNEKFDYSVEKLPRTFRIITIGASYVYGLYVNTADNFSELLEDELNNRVSCPSHNKFEVINLGFPAYDIRYTVERFIRKGLKYNTDLILWLLYDDNFIRVNEYILPIEKKLAEEGIPVYNPQYRIYERNQKAISEFNRRYSFETVLNYQSKAVQMLNDYFKGDILIAYFPNMKKEYINLIDDFVVSRKGIKTISDLTDVSNIRDYSFPEGHPNKNGHKVITQDLFKSLMRTYLSSCKFK